MTNPYHDDPRLTAYVLGELSPGETAEVEALLAESADARAAVEEIRGITNQLSDRLPAEAAPALTPAQRTAIMKGTHVTPQRQPEPAGRPGKSSTVVVAACLMVLVAGALVVFNEKGEDEPTKVKLVTNSRSMDGALSKAEWEEMRKAHITGLPRDLQGGQGKGGMGKGGKGKGGRSSKAPWGTKQPPSYVLTSPLPLRLNNTKNLSQLSTLVRQRQRLDELRTKLAYPGYKAPGNLLLGIRLRGGSPAPDSRILGGKGPGMDGRPALGLINLNTLSNQDVLKAITDGTANTSSLGTLRPGRYGDRMSLFDSRFGRLAESAERLEYGKRIARKGYYYQDLTIQDHTGPGKDGKKGAKPGTTTGPKPKRKPPTHFKPADVAKYRKNVDLYFAEVAKRLPKREVAVLRVKERVSGRLALLERHVGALEKAGKKLAVAEGRELVVKVFDAELGDVDLDGDGHKDFGAEAYDTIIENAFLTPLADPLSTFSIDVDTASYSNVRRFLDHGQLPPRNAVRIEELINYFNYDYPQPKTKDPFSVTLESGACPWNPKHQLVLIGLKGRELPHDKRPAANLVFLIDVSGSMKSAKKLPLVQLSLELLVDQMRAKDRISIVTYSNKATVVLEPTPGDQKDTILKKIHGLQAGGGTNGASGIQMAYDQAQKAFRKKGANRVILCTDGDFNIGISKDNELVKFIQEKAKSNVFLSIFGFGMGNLKDSKLEKLADKGNGNYGYIDGFNEAKKVFIEEMTGTLYTIAKDVKIQVEFNPAIVGSYRLVGYENRMLAAQDFNNDKKDAGEIGAGHSITVLYEIVPRDTTGKKKPTVDALKYQKRVKVTKDNPVSQEMLTVKLRYKQPDADKSVKIEFPLKTADAKKTAVPSENFDWAASVAMYGLLLRESKYAGDANLDLVREMATGSMGKDPEGHRSEFVKLVHRTRSLVARKLGRAVPAPRAVEAGPATK